MAEVVRKKAAKKASGKKRGRPKKVQPKTAPAERAEPAKRGRPKKAQPKTTQLEFPYDDAPQKVTAEYEAREAQAQSTPAAPVEREKNVFERNFGEGTAFDLDYGKLLIIAICIYVVVQVS